MASQENKLENQVADIARVARVTAGGRRFSFRALVIVGNKKGKVGVGVAKGADVAAAINKANYQAQQNLVDVPITKGTLPFAVELKHKSAHILLRPSPASRGIIAGGVVRTICSLAGLQGINAKILSRSNNKINNARATLLAFRKANQLLQKQRELKRGGSRAIREGQVSRIKN